MATPIADALALAPYGRVNVTLSFSSTTLVRHNGVKHASRVADLPKSSIVDARPLQVCASRRADDDERNRIEQPKPMFLILYTSA
jgi:hypothetical protein